MENRITNKVLSNGVSIPVIGMGTWPLCGEQLENLMEEAISIGYRMFDTADNYFNEESIGNVIAKHKSERDKLFMMTKISDEKKVGFPWSSIGKYFYKSSPYMQSHTARGTVDMLVNNSLRKLQTDYIDSLIIHWPYMDYILEIWDRLVELHQNGVLKSIGVSNFGIRHLELLKANFDVQPMINQLSVSPLDTKEEVLKYCKENNIQTVVYAPMQQMNNKAYSSAEITVKLTEKYNLSRGELLLAWLNSKNMIPIPKSSHVSRLKSNFDIINKGAVLEQQDVELLGTLNTNMQFLPESMFCPGL